MGSDKGILLAALSMLFVMLAISRYRQQASHFRTRLFATLFDVSNDALITTSRDFTITGWNRSAERIFGYAQAEIIGESFAVLLPPDDRAGLTVLEDVSIPHGFTDHAITMVHRDGSQFPANLRRVLRRGWLGKPSGVGLWIQDLDLAPNATADLRVRDEELAAEQKLLAEAQQIARIGSWEEKIDTREVVWSAEMYELFQMDRALPPLTRKEYLDRVHVEDRASAAEAFEALTGAIKHRIVMPDGSYQCVEQRWRPSYDNRGVPTSLFGTTQDITEREEAQKFITELVVRLTDTFESITDGFYTLDQDCRFTYANATTQEFFKKSRDELIGKSLWEVSPGPVSTEFQRNFNESMKIRRPLQLDAVKASNGDWYDVRIFPSSYGSSVHFRNVTEPVLATAALRAFARRVETAQETERSSIARDIHDRIGQALTTLRMDATRLRTRIAEDEKAGALVDEMTNVIDATLRTTRSIAMALHPMALEDLGLAAAIEMHVRNVAQSASLQVVLELGDREPTIDKARAAAAYRVLQESLTNVVRHANATEVSVRLSVTKGELFMDVVDNGRGIRLDELQRGSSLGLVGMRERAAAFDGSVDIQNIEPHGTKVSLCLPLART